MATEVQQPVYEITDKLGLPSGAEPPRLTHSFVNADDDLAVKAGGVWRVACGVCGIVEGDDIRGAGMVEKSLVETRHVGRSDETDAEVNLLDLTQIGEQRVDDSAQEARVNRSCALPTGQGEVGSLNR